MTQRRTPSGQGPARRPGRTSRPTKAPARPTSARRPGTVGGATKRMVATRPRAFTGRATVLAVVLVALALAYTYPVRVYLAQESEIAQMQAAQAVQRTVIAEKAEEVAKWRDPRYVEIQARERLFYVMPGEVPLLVLNDPVGAARDAGVSPPVAAPDRWYDTLWSSVKAADTEQRE